MNFYRQSDATFYDRVNTIYQFIKPFLDKNCLFLRNMEPLSVLWRPLNVSPYITIVQIIISFGIIEPIFVTLKIEYRLGWCWGCIQPRKLQYLYIKRLHKTESPSFVVVCVICFQRQPYKFSFDKDYICELILVTFKNRIPFKSVLGDVYSIANYNTYG